MNHLTLLHPDPEQSDNVAAMFVEGLGSARWNTGDEDEWGRELWVPALGVWTSTRKFFIVLTPPNVSIRDLVVQIVAAKIDTLEYPFRETSHPYPGEFEAMWGYCPDCTMVQTITQGRGRC